MRREILNAIWVWMGSHCSFFSVGMMWSLALRSFIRRAAVCRTEVTGCSIDEGRTERTKLQWSSSEDEESLNNYTTACFVKTTSHLPNLVKVEKACSDMKSYV